MTEDLTEALVAYELAGVHPAAELLPPMTDDELDDLGRDVKAQGFTDPVFITSDRYLLDGRHRLLAAHRSGIEATIAVVDPDDPVAWVLAKNLHRRHLTAGQKGMIVLDATDLYERLAIEAAERRTRKPTDSVVAPAPQQKTRDTAGKVVGVSGRTLTDVRAARAEPDLAEKMRLGTIDAKPAAKEARRRTKYRQARSGEPAPVSIRAPSRPKFNPTNDLIGWASWSWNPVTGCDHGCVYCYARELAERFQRDHVSGYETGFTPAFHPERLTAPANTLVPDSPDPRDSRVFVCSMADLFGKWVPREWIDQVFAACRESFWWEYLFLTKFPSRYKNLTFPPGSWAGASIDTQRRVTPTLTAMESTTATVRWLSLEPLLEPLRFPSLEMFDVVVIGAQTPVTSSMGPVAPFAPPFEWVASIVEVARRDGCAVYLKNNLLGVPDANHPGMQLPQENPKATASR